METEASRNEEPGSPYSLRSPRQSTHEVNEQDSLGIKRKLEDEAAAASTVQWSTPVNPKTGPRKKALARPEDPGGVEDVCYSETILSVPTELFKMDGLQWEERLSQGERDFLLQLLPDVENPKELLTVLFDGKTNFSFGNPVQQVWELMKQAKYREALRCLQHCQHYHNVKDYHNNMVMTLRQMAHENSDEPLQQRIQRWNAVYRDRGAHSGREIRRVRKKS